MSIRKRKFCRDTKNFPVFDVLTKTTRFPYDESGKPHYVLFRSHGSGPLDLRISKRTNMKENFESHTMHTNGDRKTPMKYGKDKPPEEGGKTNILMGRPPLDEQRNLFVQVRSRTSWSQWVQMFAKKLGVDKSTLIEHALASFARAHKFKEPPPR